MASRTIPESAIPFTAKRVKTVSNTVNNAHSGYQNGSIEWSDLTKEPLQPEIGHLHAEEGISDGLGHNATVLPEDDLENLLAYVLAGSDAVSTLSSLPLP